MGFLEVLPQVLGRRGVPVLDSSLNGMLPRVVAVSEHKILRSTFIVPFVQLGVFQIRVLNK